MSHPRPLLIALPLDHETADILAAATQLGQRLDAPLLVVHALSRRRMESARSEKERSDAAHSQLEVQLQPVRDAGVEVSEVLVEIGAAPEVVLTTAARAAAQMIVTGGGRPSTVRRWVVGSVAETIVRSSTVPVWVARGNPPDGRPLLCPVDFSPESMLGFKESVRLARLLKLPLALITVVEDEPSKREQARERVLKLIADHALDGLEVSFVVRTGDPAEAIVSAADDAGLLVIASRGYDPLVHEWLGPVTSRALRHSGCSALTIRHRGEGHDDRTRSLTRLADLHQHAWGLLANDRSQEALPILERLAEQAPANAVIQETFAIALEREGRQVEAKSRQELAELIRTRIG